ncbi:MAG: nucleotide exchange factor GrpE [Lachnospiraceae bacterium]|nr:nucleotide exchange factor GrpE [Lachnospiraceae bacterium]
MENNAEFEEKDLEAKEAETEEVRNEAAETIEIEDASEEVTEEEKEEAQEEEIEIEDAPEKKEKPDAKDEKIKELTSALIYRMAEFENFRNRTEKEKSQMFETGASSVIEKILPVIDNFERGLAVLGEEEKEDPFAQGMDKIYKQLMTILNDMDVKPIEAVGQTFDPNLHNAVMHVEDPEVGENIVVEEFQRGYTYRGNVIRYSMVKVAN